MRKTARSRLNLERLEDRWVPTIVRLIDGNLFVANPLITAGSSSITVTAIGANQLAVSDNGQFLGTYTVGGNLFIAGSNATDTINVDLKGQTFSGNVFVNSGTGNDTTNLTNSVGAVGTVSGSVTVLSANGNADVNMNNTDVNTLNFGGTINAIAIHGDSEFCYGNPSAPTTSGGDVNVINFPDVRLGETANDQILGNVAIQNAQTTIGDSILIQDNLTIGGSVNYTGGTGPNQVNLNAATIQRNAAFNLGPGNSSFVPTTNNPFLIYGNLTITGGSGNDTIAFTTNGNTGTLPTVQGDLTIQLGDGNNILFGDNQAFSVFGNMTVSAGNGNNTTNSGHAFLDALVSGNLTMNLGNGNNTFTFPAAPVGKFTWRSGNGINTLSLGLIGFGGGFFGVPGTGFFAGGGNQLLNADIAFGNNDDTLNVDIGTFGGGLTGRIDGGGRINGNTFNLISGTLVQPFQLSNFP